MDTSDVMSIIIFTDFADFFLLLTSSFFVDFSVIRSFLVLILHLMNL